MSSWQKLEDVKKFEIELSSHCNARCPLCIRQVTGTDKERAGFHKGHITLEQIKKLINQLPNPKQVVFYFGGVGGDPMMNPEVVDIFRYCVERVKGVYMDTNASLRSKDVWHELGVITKSNNNYTTFSRWFTRHNHYRIKLIGINYAERKTYISIAGGVAEWKYIIFKHNEHQVNEAEKLANGMGFAKFIKEPSVRHYLDNVGELSPEPPSITERESIRHNASRDAKKINCKVLEKNMMYITHDFKLLPCCYVMELINLQKVI